MRLEGSGHRLVAAAATRYGTCISTERSIATRTIPAREIKRRGIGIVDEALREGPVHVIKRDQPAYVILDEAQYTALLEARDEAYGARVREALDDLRAGRVRRVTAQQLVDEFDLGA